MGRPKPHKLAVDAVKQQMRNVGASSYELSQLEVVELAHVIMQDETIQAFIFGYYDAGYGLLVATEQRIIFIDKRFYNLKVEDITYSTVNSVEYHLGFFFGIVRLFTRSENFKFWWVKKNNVMKFCEYVDKKVLKYQNKSITEKDSLG